jgi:NAD(P)-dependent dehydrogenase (short-subunit alcohol dehydrogenase family)
VAAIARGDGDRHLRARAVRRSDAERRRGCIVNVSSINATEAFRSASRLRGEAAVEMTTRVLAVEWADGVCA